MVTFIMRVYNMLKSGAVLVGLASGSAALAAGINSIGSLLGGDAWERAARGVESLPRSAGAYVAQGGQVGQADFGLFAPGQGASDHAGGGFGGGIVPRTILEGSGKFDFDFGAGGQRMAPMRPFQLGAASSGGAGANLTAAESARSVFTPRSGAMGTSPGMRQLASGTVPGPLAEAAPLSFADTEAGAVSDPLDVESIAPVPLPAGALLMLSALFGLGAVRSLRA
ncbi:hypothetical protein [Rhodovulum sp. ES.010]|uniref:hypothetical protein n=1 Tax=Rhodovulum sp. ES.010 TaxID=1882821 RepID=UPI00111547A4|nr:hypothetical protein [Rhodovulum sp. ES.010]